MIVTIQKLYIYIYIIIRHFVQNFVNKTKSVSIFLHGIKSSDDKQVK